jgi:hypothetical protein
MVRTDGLLVHAGDDRRATGSADPGRGEGSCIANAFTGKLVYVWRLYRGIPLTTQVGRNILTGNPDNVRPILGRLSMTGSMQSHEQE